MSTEPTPPAPIAEAASTPEAAEALVAKFNTPPAAAPTLPPEALPQVVWQATMSAICEYENQTGKVIYDGNLLHGLVCAALAPLWPKLAPAPSDAEVAAAAERLKVVADATSAYHMIGQSERDSIRTVLAVLAPVLARAEAAERERDQLSAEVGRLSELATKRYVALEATDELLKIAEAKNIEITREWSAQVADLRAQLTAAQAQAREATKHKNTLLVLVERYLKETPLGHQPSMIALVAERAIEAARNSHPPTT